MARRGDSVLYMTTKYKSPNRRVNRPSILVASIAAMLVVNCRTTAHAQLTITPTFDNSYTSAQETAVNAAILQIESEVTTAHGPVTVRIDFQTTTNPQELGSNIAALGTISLSQYESFLASNPNMSALQSSALATMPTGAISSLNNDTTVTLTAANLAAIGDTSAANAAISKFNSNNDFNGNGIISLNTSILNASRTNITSTSYADLETTALHEIDEQLGGIGGFATTLGLSGSSTPSTLGSSDFFRYTAPGVRSFTLNTSQDVYFSVDGGVTKLVSFNQHNGTTVTSGDYGDFLNSPNGPYYVQDASGTSYAQDPVAPNLSIIELTGYQVAGYNLLIAPAKYWLGSISGAWNTSYNWSGTSVGVATPLLPTSSADIVFSASGAAFQGAAMTLGQNFTIHSLTDSDSSSLGISSGFGGAYSLTISGASGTGIAVNSGAGTFTLNAPLILAGSSNTITVNNSLGAVINGAIGGSIGLVKAGAGKLTLTGGNSYTGATNVNAGTLELDGTIASGSTVNVGTAGILSGSGTINGGATLTGNGIINFSSGGNVAGTLGVTGGNWNGVGTVAGLVTSSSGTFNLNGSLTAPSGLTVTGGTLAGNGNLTGTLFYSSSASSTFAGVVAGNSSVSISNASSTLILTGTSTSHRQHRCLCRDLGSRWLADRHRFRVNGHGGNARWLEEHPRPSLFAVGRNH